MTEIFIKHNPYTVKTEFKIDGEEIYSESRLLTFAKEKLDIWINELIPILQSELNEDNFKIIFYGIDRQYDKLKELCRTYNNKNECIRLEYIPIKSTDSKLKHIENLVNLMQDGNFEELKKQETQQDFNKIVSCTYADQDTFISNITPMLETIAETIQKRSENIYKFSEEIYIDAKEKLKCLQNKLENMTEEKTLNNQSIQEDKLCIEDIDYKLQHVGEYYQKQIDNEVQDKIAEWNDLFIKKYPHIAYTDISRVESYIIQEMVIFLVKQFEQLFSNAEINLEKIIIELKENLSIICKYRSQQALKNFFATIQVEFIKVNEYFKCIQNENKNKANEIQQKLEELLLEKEKVKFSHDIIAVKSEIFDEEQILKGINEARKEFKQITKYAEKQLQETLNYEKQNYIQNMQNVKLKMSNLIKINIQEMSVKLSMYRSYANTYMYVDLIINEYNKLVSKFWEKCLCIIKFIEQSLEKYMIEIFNNILLMQNCNISGLENIIGNRVYIKEIEKNLEYLDNITDELINVLQI